MGLVDVQRLKEIVGAENVKDDKADLYVYGSDSSVHQAMPWVVVRPHTIEEVQNVMRYANPRMIPVIARGAGSGMSGQAVPINGQIPQVRTTVGADFEPGIDVAAGRSIDTLRTGSVRVPAVDGAHVPSRPNQGTVYVRADGRPLYFQAPTRSTN